MRLVIWFFAWLVLLTWTFAACQISYGQMYPLPDSNGTLLGELKKDCYGPAISCDGTGRAFHWRPEGTQDGPNVVIEPKVNAYGFGRSSDQFGRPIEPSLEDVAPSRGRTRSRAFGFGKNQDDE